MRMDVSVQFNTNQTNNECKKNEDKQLKRRVRNDDETAYNDYNKG